MSEQRYTLAELYRKGQISSKVFNYKEIKDKVLQLKATGLSNGQAVNQVAQDLGRSRQAIYLALRNSL